MSRFADQLPINTEPTAGNFLLATNDSDSKALERIPFSLVGVGGGGSTEYTILDETALDENSNVALAAGLYLYVGNAPANFDLSALVDGERVEIINHTAHKVYLFGFTNWVWNGTTTALQTDKGLTVEKGGLIGAKHSGNLLLFNTLPNALSQGFRPGLAPLDPYANNIVLFLKGDGQNNSASIIDSSSNNFLISVFGSAKITTEKAKYNSSCIDYGASVANYTLTNGVNVQFSNSFTVEGWYFVPTWNDAFSFFQFTLDGQSPLICSAYANSVAFFPANQSFVFNSGFVPPSDAWFHVAVSCNAGILRIFINGIQRGANFNYTYPSPNLISIQLGRDANNKYTKFVSHFRLSVGISRYNQNFNPEEDTFLNV